MSDPNSAPVTLAAGSFDYDALKSGLDKAAKGAAKNYDGGVQDALAAAADHAFDAPDSRAIPGYKFKDVKNDELGVTENIQVFDAKLAEKQEPEEAPAAPPPVIPENLAAAKAAVAAQE